MYLQNVLCRKTPKCHGSATLISGHKLESLSVFYPHFSFHKMLFTKRREFSCFADFWYVSVKPEKNLIFFKNLPLERL
jgi:hypothetical protein